MSIDTHRIIQWGDTIRQRAQQMDSRLMRAVNLDPSVDGKRATIEFLASSGDVEEVTARHQPTHINDPEHERRHLILRDFVKAIMLDDEDLAKVRNDPRPRFIESIAAAFGRSEDDAIVAAFLATALTGEDGTGTAAFDTTNFQIVHGSVGMTIAKWRSAKRRLVQAENIERQPEDFFIALTAEQIYDDLLATTEVTSADFNTVKALVNGDINRFMGMEVIQTERLAKASTTRSCMAWLRMSMEFGFGKNSRPRAFVSRRPDLNENWQVLFKGSYGATRVNETGVVEIQCTEVA